MRALLSLMLDFVALLGHYNLAWIRILMLFIQKKNPDALFR
jgi:hypothetical protein